MCDIYFCFTRFLIPYTISRRFLLRCKRYDGMCPFREREVSQQPAAETTASVSSSDESFNLVLSQTNSFSEDEQREYEQREGEVEEIDVAKQIPQYDDRHSIVVSLNPQFVGAADLRIMGDVDSVLVACTTLQPFRCAVLAKLHVKFSATMRERQVNAILRESRNVWS